MKLSAHPQRDRAHCVHPLLLGWSIWPKNFVDMSQGAKITTKEWNIQTSFLPSPSPLESSTLEQSPCTEILRATPHHNWRKRMFFLFFRINMAWSYCFSQNRMQEKTQRPGFTQSVAKSDPGPVQQWDGECSLLCSGWGPPGGQGGWASRTAFLPFQAPWANADYSSLLCELFSTSFRREREWRGRRMETADQGGFHFTHRALQSEFLLGTGSTTHPLQYSGQQGYQTDGSRIIGLCFEPVNWKAQEQPQMLSPRTHAGA